jgi:beta-glucosidase
VIDLSPAKGLSSTAINARVEEILAAATLEEKVAMMSGRGFFEQFRRSGGDWGAEPYRAGGGCERLGVPALWFTDGPRGVARGQSTCFPVSMARGASWDPALERRIGEAMAMEARAQGCNLSGAVCINLLRHPGWGRAQETYGEDPFHLGELGAALAEGLQAHNVIATVKHIAANSIENNRFTVDVRIDQRTLREVYLPHFRRVIEAGCASVMSAYNRLNGEHCGQHRQLLTEILRQEWGFEGFVHSDWVLGVHAVYGASAGLDIENPEPVHFGEKLVRAVQDGLIAPEVIDTACRRILRTLYRFACAEDPLPTYAMDLVACPAHVALAREAAEKSAVLLRNRAATLPLSRQQRIAVLGRLATLENTGDGGSSRVSPPWVVTPLAGIAEALGQPALALAGDEQDPEAAAVAAAAADAAIVVVGYTAKEEGEYIPGDISLGEAGDLIQETGGGEGAARPPTGGDRRCLELPADQQALIRAVAQANPRTVVVLIAGSAVLVEGWLEATGAVLQTFYAGMEGGRALASLLFGDVSPSAKLPYGPLHGYRWLEVQGREARFPFGHGLSYTQFRYRAFRLRRTVHGVHAEVSVQNTGAVPGEEVVQLYVRFPGCVVERQGKQLRGFQRIALAPGETGIVRLQVPEHTLHYWHEQSHCWRLEPGKYRFLIGGSSAEGALLSESIDL